jgi:hypothetical protein
VKEGALVPVRKGLGASHGAGDRCVPENTDHSNRVEPIRILKDSAFR